MRFIEYEMEDRVAVIRMNRPERLNAMSADMRKELITAFQRFVQDEDAWVGILTGTGRGFCAGRDLKAEAQTGKPPEPVYTKEWNLFGVADTDKPLIAAVNGFAVGAGWYMMIGCDIRVAVESAQFWMGEVPTGVLGPYWLAGVEGMPWSAAFEFAALGERVSARKLLGFGVLNEVVPDDELMPAARRWAKRIVALPPMHVRRTKQLMRAMRPLPDADMLANETATRRYLNALEDTHEAVNAFAEKRPPEFRGR